MVRRSKVETLPKDLKEWLDRVLVEKNFSGYEFVVEEANRRLEEAGADFRLSKSSINRYGAQFDQRLRALKLASEQARAIVSAAPDEEGAVSEALMRLVQEKMFQALLEFQIDPDKPINIASAAKAVSEMQRATVTQKKWLAEVREKAQSAADAVDSLVRKGGLSDAAADDIRRRILGIAV